MVVTAGGRAIRFAADDLRQMGRGAQGVRAIRLNEGDKVVAVVAL
jgi:DNA gyrase subunit A